jgi:hypothetical protein
LQGILPNLDCDESSDLSPSQNWYYDIDKTWFPWGRRWRFKVRGYVANDPASKVEEWFCLQIYNNWSYDRDQPLILEMTETQIETIEESVELSPEPCCEEEPVVAQSLRPLDVTPCPCESNQGNNKTEVTFLKWYQSNLQNENNSPEIQAFINNFKASDYYTNLIEKNNIVVDLDVDPKERELDILDKLITSLNAKLIDGERNKADIDYVMIEQVKKENQSLPITSLSFSGTTLFATLR